MRQEASTALPSALCFSFGSFFCFFPSINLKDQYHGKLRYMDRAAALTVRDLSSSPCIIAPGTNHESVHFLGVLLRVRTKKTDLLRHFLNVFFLKELGRKTVPNKNVTDQLKAKCTIIWQRWTIVMLIQTSKLVSIFICIHKMAII